jgi:hypothetical protein
LILTLGSTPNFSRVTADNGKTIEQLRRQFDMREIGTTSHWGVDSFQVTRLITEDDHNHIVL